MRTLGEMTDDEAMEVTEERVPEEAAAPSTDGDGSK